MNERRHRLDWSVATVAAVALSLAIMSAPAQAVAAQPKSGQPAKPLKGGPRADWTGTWVIVGSYLDRQDGTSIALRTGRPEVDVQFKDIFMPPPKLGPEALKQVKIYADAAAVGHPIDPRQCGRPGMPFFWSGLYAFEIVQSRTQMNVYQELGEATRRIYLDGRKHPSLDDAEPLTLGHSIGHWQGDDLIVDTVNIKTESVIFQPGTNHTEKSHVVERFHPVGDDKMDIELTLENPDVLAEPYHVVRHLVRKPNMEIMDYDCEENNRNPIDAEGKERPILQK